MYTQQHWKKNHSINNVDHNCHLSSFSLTCYIGYDKNV